MQKHVVQTHDNKTKMLYDNDLYIHLKPLNEAQRNATSIVVIGRTNDNPVTLTGTEAYEQLKQKYEK